MPSLIPGYNYDIFISYRQKDNKHNSWVTEFVNNLKGELESTFKEDISVYFDINPHDGLLETHDVDASLEDKLKCLIFIPIISRTYCDPKSFAWEHEFKAFLRQAKEDHFGLKVKLPNGNVANRMLPVIIHDLDNEDIKLCESVLGGALRGVEFIYRYAGVNRPLRAVEEKPNENLNNTIYRDQVNKVALAIKEIINSIHHEDQKTDIVTGESRQGTGIKSVRKSRLITSMVIAAMLIISGIILLPGIFRPSSEPEKSIAVLPFFNDSPDEKNNYFINGIMDEILNNLQAIKELRVISRSSVEQYRSRTRPNIREIASELNVNYIIEGSGQKYGDEFRLRVQLIEARRDKHLWARSYEKKIEETSDIFEIQNQIAESIASELNAAITPFEKEIIEKSSTSNLTAYDFLNRANEELQSYRITSDRSSLDNSERLFREALTCDSTLAKAYAGLAKVYFAKNFWKEFLKKSFMDSVFILSDIALSFDERLSDAYSLKGNYYSLTGDTEKAFDEFNQAIKYNPNNSSAYIQRGKVYVNYDLVKALDDFSTALSLDRSHILGLYYGISGILIQAGIEDKARYYCSKAFELERDSLNYLKSMHFIEASKGNYGEAIKCLEGLFKIDSTDLEITGYLGYYHQLNGNSKESLNYFNKIIANTDFLGEGIFFGTHRIGLALWKNGFRKESEYYFNKQYEYCMQMNELNRAFRHRARISYDLAAIYAFRGEKDKALECQNKFEQALKICNLYTVNLIKNDPLFENVKNEPEFLKIVRDIEYRYQADHERVKKWLEKNDIL